MGEDVDILGDGLFFVDEQTDLAIDGFQSFFVGMEYFVDFMLLLGDGH